MNAKEKHELALKIYILKQNNKPLPTDISGNYIYKFRNLEYNNSYYSTQLKPYNRKTYLIEKLE